MNKQIVTIGPNAACFVRIGFQWKRMMKYWNKEGV